jgi:hypothetical protein
MDGWFLQDTNTIGTMFVSSGDGNRWRWANCRSRAGQQLLFG